MRYVPVAGRRPPVPERAAYSRTLQATFSRNLIPPPSRRWLSTVCPGIPVHIHFGKIAALVSSCHTAGYTNYARPPRRV
jgi:hypothetical protein